MNPVQKTLMKAAGKVAVRVYRASGGKVGGKALGGAPVLLLTVRGRKTGTPRTTPVSYFRHEGGYVVVGSAGGAPEQPQWFRNLSKATEAEIEIGRQHHVVSVRVLHDAERDSVWTDVVLATTPEFGQYETKTTRTIPLALLTPLD